MIYTTSCMTRRFSRLRGIGYGAKGCTNRWNRRQTPRSLGSCVGKLPVGLRDDLKARRFVPQRVRDKTIPKASGRVRSLGIPTAADRVVQASLNLVLKTETISASSSGGRSLVDGSGCVGLAIGGVVWA